MRKIYLIGAALIGMMAVACNNDQNTPEVEPKAPVITSATLKAEGGASEMELPGNVSFNAAVTVENSTLEAYTIEVKRGAEVVKTIEGNLDLTNANISKTFALGIDPATVTEDFYLTVTIKVTNTDKQFTEKTLTEAENVKILAPKEYEKLYLIGGAAPIELSKTGTPGFYRSTGAAPEVPATFSIASAVNGNAAANGAKVWSNLSKPETGAYGIAWIGFNTLTEKVEKMLDHVVTIDLNGMAEDAAVDNNGNPYKVIWAMRFVNDCCVEFLNAPDGLQLQGDRFDNAEGTRARYTGDTNDGDNMFFEVYYIQDVKWLILKYCWVPNNVFWITGDHGSQPMAPFTEGHPFSWFDNSKNGLLATTAMTFVKESDEIWRGLVYMGEKFACSLYTEVKWVSEITPWTSANSNVLVSSTNDKGNTYGDIAEGAEPGLYMFRFNNVTNKLSVEKWNGEIPVIRIPM